MGLLKGLRNRHQDEVHEVDDGGRAFIDLPDLGLHDVRPSSEEITWARPSRCPRCASAGYLDRIDIESHTMYQHCPVCWHKWELVVDG